MWVSTVDLARACEISRQKAHAALQRGQRGLEWRGAVLLVRQVHGRGGRSGIGYEVHIDSLPWAVRERLTGHRNTVEFDADRGKGAQAERDWWYAIIRPALAHPAGSPERGAAIAEMAAREHVTPDGEIRQFSRRTIERKVAGYERGAGMAALGKRGRSDKGRTRVVISAQWSKAAADLAPEVRARLAVDLRDYVRALQKNRDSRGQILWKASQRLQVLTRAAGVDVPAEACHVPREFVDAERRFRKVGQFKQDRKAFEDARPRIMRTRGQLMPMEIVVGDVHHLDFVLRDEPGFGSNPKAIAWLDLATNRIWMDVVRLPTGRGVRNADVIASFKRMVDAWGAPGTLYLDNGQEYRWSEFIDDALKLIAGDRRRIRIEQFERSSQIVRAMPYNAAAKAIEGIFGVLEKHHFASLPGWIGGDRMKKKTANVGRAPDPFPGSFDGFVDMIDGALRLYAHKPQGGDMGGKSPAAAFAEAIDRGWTMTAVDPVAFDIAFSVEQTRIVRQGFVEYDGRKWTCPELQSYLGDRVTLRVPKYATWGLLPIEDEDGKFLGLAAPDRAFHPLDPAGARESHARAARQRKAVRALDRSAPTVDPLRDLAEHVASLPAPIRAPVGATIAASPEARRLASAISEDPADRRYREMARSDDNIAAHLAIMAKRRAATGG